MNKAKWEKVRKIATWVVAAYLIAKLLMKNLEMQQYDYALLILMHGSIFANIYLKIKKYLYNRKQIAES